MTTTFANGTGSPFDSSVTIPDKVPVAICANDKDVMSKGMSKAVEYLMSVFMSSDFEVKIVLSGASAFE
jgi:hypothetical protein